MPFECKFNFYDIYILIFFTVAMCYQQSSPIRPCLTSSPVSVCPLAGRLLFCAAVGALRCSGSLQTDASQWKKPVLEVEGGIEGWSQSLDRPGTPTQGYHCLDKDAMSDSSLSHAIHSRSSIYSYYAQSASSASSSKHV